MPKHSLPPQEQILSYMGRFINCPYGTPENGTGLFLCALVGLGLRKLSMSASQLAKVKRALSRHTAVQLQRLAGEILACEDAGEVLQCMQAALAL